MIKLEKQNNSIAIDFEKGHIVSFCSCGREILHTVNPVPLFSACLRDKDGEGIVISAFDAAKCLVSESGGGYTAGYSGFKDANVTVNVRVMPHDDPYFLKWRLDVINRSNSAVEWVDYPQMLFVEKSAARGNCQILWPYNEGALISDIHQRDNTMFAYKEPGYPGESVYAIYPGMVESQFIAYMGDAGVYFGAHDPAFGTKNIDYVPMEGAVRLKLRIYAAGTFGGNYTMGFDIVHALYDGGWHDAAEIYRRWFDANKTMELKKIGLDKTLPPWYGNSPVVIIYPVRGLHDMDIMKPNSTFFPYINALPVVEELSKALGSKVMVLLMHWEGTAPWAPPYVWPPYGGKALLKEYSDALHEKGHLLGVYLSGTGWTQQSNIIEEYNMEGRFDEEGFKDIVSLSPKQELLESRICTGQRRGYDLCPACGQTADILLQEVRELYEAGIDYAQILDQNHGGHPYFCYARNHGHPPVPGVWQTKAMQELLGQIGQSSDGMLFGCESAASEPYIHRLRFSDNRFNLSYFYGEPVPLYSYIYHEYVSNFMGNQICVSTVFRPTDISLQYRLAYSFAAGDMLTLVLTGSGDIMQSWGSRDFVNLPNRQNILTLVRNLNAMRRGAAAGYLHGGRMIKPLELTNVEAVDIPVFEPYPALIVPKLLTSRWLGPDGSCGQILVNFNNSEASCEVEPEHGVQHYAITNDSSAVLKDGRVTVAPLSALLITDCPDCYVPSQA